MKDYYQTLNLDKSAKLKDIKKAYKKMALKWHPDRNKNQNAEEIFKKIAQAYEILNQNIFLHQNFN